MAFLWILSLLVLIILFIILLLYNSLIRLKNSVYNSWSGIDVQLKRRADLIPSLVKAVKGYIKHEKNVLEGVTSARTAILHSNGDVKKSATAEGLLEKSLLKLFAVAENYPKLQSSENFISLQNELTQTEDEIASARRIYNDNVREYNTKLQVFPNNLISSFFNFKKIDYFQINSKDKKNIPINF